METRVDNGWKERFNYFLKNCHDEFRKTTVIGKKMISASRINNSLRESYVELGMLTVEAIRNSELDWDSRRARELLEMISSYEEDLKTMEIEVEDLKQMNK